MKKTVPDQKGSPASTADKDKSRRNKANPNNIQQQSPSMAPPKMVHLKAGETLKFASQSTSFQDMREGKARLVKVSTPAKAKASPNGGKSNEGSKNADFPPHYIDAMVKQGMSKGLLISGTLRINPRAFEDAFLTSTDYNDVYINGVMNRNRALHGDEVVVDVFPESEWRVLDDQVTAHLDEVESITQQIEEGLDLQGSSDKAREEKKTVGQVVEIDELSEASERSDDEAGDSPDDVSACEEEEEDSEDDEDIVIEAVTDENGAELKPSEENGQKIRDGKVVDRRIREACAAAGVPLRSPAQSRQGRLRSTGQGENSKEYSIAEVKEMFPKEWHRFVQKTGRVVAILQFNHSRKAVGYIKDRPGDTKYGLFAPTDARVPRILIPRNNLPKEFWARQQDFASTLFAASITAWEKPKFAMGRLLKRVGDDSDISNCTEAILMNNDVDSSDFPPEVTSTLPNLPFVIPKDEIKKRRDFRKHCVFTIDPLTARDLDDALSVERLDDGRFRIGVHIADVSYFVDEKTDLDASAADRATSVYLVQKVIPMLPRVLCEDLCSLNPGEDRLAFSVEWVMTESGDICEGETWFGRSVINSCVKLAYEHAQEMLDNPSITDYWTEERVNEQLPEIRKPFGVSDIVEKVNMLNRVALNLKQKRVDSGALRLDQPKMCFALDKESGLPLGFRQYKQRQSNSLIEEFMLLANVTVAKKIYDSFPEVSILRNHPPPKQNIMERVEKVLHKYGFKLDGTSSKALQVSLAAARIKAEKHGDPTSFQLLVNLCSMPMQNAKYLCSGWYNSESEYRHYALSVPFYTHFTSPIRRYPDILVHRLLQASIEKDSLEDPVAKGRLLSHWDKAQLQQVASHCNVKKLAAKMASTQSDDLFFASFIRECGPYTVKAAVLKVLDHSFDILITEGGAMTRRVYLDRLQDSGQLVKVSSVKPAPGKTALDLMWSKTPEDKDKVMGRRQRIEMFDVVSVNLVSNPNKPLDILAVLNRPGSTSDDAAQAETETPASNA